MRTADSDGPVRPVLFQDAHGDRLGAALMNTKAQLKSLEQGVPWIVDGETGRLLPWPGGGKISQIDDRQADYLIVELDRAFAPAQNATLEPAGRRQAPQSIEPSRNDQPGAKISVDPDYLYELETVVRQRRHDLPAGSYTSHLFTAGLAKIRKKVGEEAVELLLAQALPEIRSEAADLVYHLTVLFVAAGVSWAEVLSTLKDR